jgi:hypothetical protein
LAERLKWFQQVSFPDVELPHPAAARHADSQRQHSAIVSKFVQGVSFAVNFVSASKNGATAPKKTTRKASAAIRSALESAYPFFKETYWRSFSSQIYEIVLRRATRLVDSHLEHVRRLLGQASRSLIKLDEMKVKLVLALLNDSLVNQEGGLRDQLEAYCQVMIEKKGLGGLMVAKPIEPLTALEFAKEAGRLMRARLEDGTVRVPLLKQLGLWDKKSRPLRYKTVVVAATEVLCTDLFATLCCAALPKSAAPRLAALVLNAQPQLSMAKKPYVFSFAPEQLESLKQRVVASLLPRDSQPIARLPTAFEVYVSVFRDAGIPGMRLECPNVKIVCDSTTSPKSINFSGRPLMHVAARALQAVERKWSARGTIKTEMVPPSGTRGKLLKRDSFRAGGEFNSVRVLLACVMLAAFRKQRLHFKTGGTIAGAEAHMRAFLEELAFEHGRESFSVTAQGNAVLLALFGWSEILPRKLCGSLTVCTDGYCASFGVLAPGVGRQKKANAKKSNFSGTKKRRKPARTPEPPALHALLKERNINLNSPNVQIGAIDTNKANFTILVASDGLAEALKARAEYNAETEARSAKPEGRPPPPAPSAAVADELYTSSWKGAAVTKGDVENVLRSKQRQAKLEKKTRQGLEIFRDAALLTTTVPAMGKTRNVFVDGAGDDAALRRRAVELLAKSLRAYYVNFFARHSAAHYQDKLLGKILWRRLVAETAKLLTDALPKAARAAKGPLLKAVPLPGKSARARERERGGARKSRKNRQQQAAAGQHGDSNLIIYFVDIFSSAGQRTTSAFPYARLLRSVRRLIERTRSLSSRCMFVVIDAFRTTKQASGPLQYLRGVTEKTDHARPTQEDFASWWKSKNPPHSWKHQFSPITNRLLDRDRAACANIILVGACLMFGAPRPAFLSRKTVKEDDE